VPNSLIFAVILAVWAAYLIQHWIRRRDHVATAKSVDRFSEAMRVLERRQSAPRADLKAPTPRSYSVSLTRPAHPDVVVKRARHGAAEPAPRRTRRRFPRPSAATLRALFLVLGVLSLAGGVTVWALGITPFGITPWWGAAAGAAGLLLALTLVRLSVGRQRRRATSPVRRTATHPYRAVRSEPAGRETRREKARPRTDRRPVSSRTSRSSARKSARPAPSRRPATRPAAASVGASAGAVDVSPAADDVSADEVFSPGEAVAGGEGQFFDVEAHDPTPVAAVAAAGPGTPSVGDTGAEVAAEPQPGTWAPVPVPPPTYTLKARATRPGAPTPEASPPASADTGRVEDLPFDGHALAFDEEFEDLPPVHSVG